MNNFLFGSLYLYLVVIVFSIILLRNNFVELIIAFVLFGDSLAGIISGLNLPYSILMFLVCFSTLILVDFNRVKFDIRIILIFIILILLYLFASFTISSDYGEYKLKYYLYSMFSFAALYPFLSFKLLDVNFKFDIASFTISCLLFFSSVFVTYGSLKYLWLNYNPEIEHIGLRAIKNFSSIGFGRSAGLLSLIAFYSVISFRKQWNLVVVFVVTFTQSFILLYLTQTRQGMVALYLSFFVCIYCYMKNKKAAVVSGVLLFIVSLINILASSIEDSGRMQFNFDNRSEHWQNSIDQILSSPVIGKGIGNYVEGLWYWPHNLFLEMLVEINILYFIFFILLLFICVITCLKLSKYPDVFNGLIISMFFYIFICSQVSADIPRNTVIFFVMMIIYIVNVRMCSVYRVNSS